MGMQGGAGVAETERKRRRGRREEDGGWLAEARRKNKNFRIIGGNEVLGAGIGN